MKTELQINKIQLDKNKPLNQFNSKNLFNIR